MTTPFSPDLYPKAQPARSKAERRPAGSAPPHRTSRTTRPRRLPPSPTLTLESSHPTPLFAGISQLVSATFKVGSGGGIICGGEGGQFVFKSVTGSGSGGQKITHGQNPNSRF